MNEHAGPACALSCLIVGLFAVLLHDKTPLSAVPPSPARSLAGEPRPVGKSTSVPPDVLPQPDHGNSPVGTSKVADGGSKPPANIEVRTPPPSILPPSPPLRSESKEARITPPAPKKLSHPSPRPPFAVVEAGETLSDVALRIYGSKDSAQGLWKANRDQVERVDSAMARGTLLRTP